jgi:hypothetical protein
MASSRDPYEYRGFTIGPTQRPSKNRRFGPLHYWTIADLPRAGTFGPESQLFHNRPDAERAVDEHLDGKFDVAESKGVRVVVFSTARGLSHVRGAAGVVEDVTFRKGYDDRPMPDKVRLRLDDGRTVEVDTFAVKREPGTSTRAGLEDTANVS